MFKSVSSRLRKFLVATLTFAMAFTGLSAVSANAAGVTYAASNATYERSYRVSVALTNNSVAIPSGASDLNASFDITLGTDFLAANIGKVLSVQIKAFGPTGVQQNGQNGTANASPFNTISLCDSSYQVCDRTNETTTSLVIKSGHVHGSIFGNLSLYNIGSGSGPSPLTPGTYTLEFKVLADSTEVALDGTSAGATINRKDATFWVKADTYNVGADVTNISLHQGICVDSSKIAVNDVLTPGVYVNDVQKTLQRWDVNLYSRSQDSPNPRQNQQSQSSTITVDQNDIDSGLAISINTYQDAPTVGAAFAIQSTVVNQNGTDVTGDCAPPAPSKPTLALQGSTLSATVSGLHFTQGAECSLFLASDLTTAVKTASAMSMMQNSPATCSFTNAAPGTSYVVKTRGYYGSVKGAYSEASAPVTAPFPGVTFTTAVSGGDNGGQVSLVSKSVASQTSANSIRVSADGKGGTLRLSVTTSVPSCPPCGPSTSAFKLEQTTTTGYVSSFAGTGKVDFAPTGATPSANAAWYGAPDKWTLSTITYATLNSQSASLEVLQGNYGSATTASTSVAASTFEGACATLGSGYTAKYSAQSTSFIVYPVSAPTAKQLFSLTCYKPTTLADNATVSYLPNPVLVTIDGPTTVSVVKVLGVSDGTTNSTQVTFSANPQATAGQNALTAIVTKKLVTAMTNVNGLITETSTISGRELVRFTPALTSTTTTAAWDTGNTAGATEPFLLAPQVNDGSFYVMLRGQLAYKLMKIPASGAASAAVTITNDKSSDFMMPAYLWPTGLQSGSLANVSLVLSGAASAGVLSVNTATGEGKAAEVVKFTQTLGTGFTSQFVIDSASKDVFWWHSNSAADSGKIAIYKWINPLFVKPTGPVPAVTSKNLDYATNTPAAGTKVTFTGTNLNVATGVKFGSAAGTIGTKTATSLEVTVPAGSGVVDVTIESANGNGSGGTFTYVGANKVAQTVALTSGANTAKVGDADRTLSATASMQGYTATQSITFSSSTTAVCTVISTNKLHFVAAGTCTVKATQAASGWAAEGSATANITVTAVVVPTVTTQVSGKATNTPAAGTKLTIAGTNLDKVTSVKFGTVAGTIGTRSTTSLEVTVPAGATGTVTITLVHANGSVTAGSFIYVGATKLAQTVTLVSGAANALVGDADRTLSATVKIGADAAVASLSYSSSTPLVCTVNGAKLHFVTSGTCTVKATQAATGWAAEGVATANITVKKPQTVTVLAPSAAEKLVSVEGIFVYASATSGGALTYTFSTPTVCNKGTFVANHVLNIKEGTCTILVSQAGDANWAPASATLTYTVGKAATTAIVDAGNVTSPVTLPNTGTKVNVLSEVLSWTKATGALNVSSRGIWVGPITATATFKVGTTNYTCSATYGTLKAVTDATANQVKGFPATNLCSGTSATDKAALAALKGLKTTVTVKIVVVRDLRSPSNYATKGQNTTRSIYVNVG